VPVAIDQWYTRRQKDAEGDWYRKVAAQGPLNDFSRTTQGLYACTADGKLLGYSNHRSPDRTRPMLKKALEAFAPADAAPLSVPARDPHLLAAPPDGGLVVTVTSKILAGYEETDRQETRIFHGSLGRDVLWVLKDEHEALARGEFPDRLKKRMARFHLIDNTRGEPAMWTAEEVKHLEISLKEGKLTGEVRLEADSKNRGHDANLLGFVEAKDGKVTRFDLVSRGPAWGYSGTTEVGAPKGRFTLAVAFRLASGADEADKAMPQGAKGWIPGYTQLR
jgi:hypothetical protein